MASCPQIHTDSASRNETCCQVSLRPQHEASGEIILDIKDNIGTVKIEDSWSLELYFCVISTLFMIVSILQSKM